MTPKTITNRVLPSLFVLGAMTLAPLAQAQEQDAPAQPPKANEATTMLELDATTLFVNVMGRAMPKLPKFAPLSPKKGVARGYVKDVKGKPLANAKIGIRSTLVGGSYSGAHGQTDAKGYYEIVVPYGACEFYNAGYAVDYGDGRAALGLHPADGELTAFASENGGVENFVLLPYGIADRDGVQDNPAYSGNYYGGTFSISYDVAEGSLFDLPSDLPEGSTLEITLAPQTPLLDGSKGSTFVIRKPVGRGFSVVNIPIATYRLSARLVGGGPLKFKEVGINGGQTFGIQPKEAEGAVWLQLRPDTAKAERVTPGHGNWAAVSLDLSR